MVTSYNDVLFSRELTNRNTVDALVSDFEVLQTVGLVLIKYSAKWQEERTYGTLLKNIIRILYSYLSYNNSKSLGYVSIRLFKKQYYKSFLMNTSNFCKTHPFF